jgi:hypothetical protein
VCEYVCDIGEEGEGAGGTTDIEQAMNTKMILKKANEIKGS